MALFIVFYVDIILAPSNREALQSENGRHLLDFTGWVLKQATIVIVEWFHWNNATGFLSDIAFQANTHILLSPDIQQNYFHWIDRWCQSSRFSLNWQLIFTMYRQLSHNWYQTTFYWNPLKWLLPKVSGRKIAPSNLKNCCTKRAHKASMGLTKNGRSSLKLFFFFV